MPNTQTVQCDESTCNAPASRVVKEPGKKQKPACEHHVGHFISMAAARGVHAHAVSIAKFDDKAKGSEPPPSHEEPPPPPVDGPFPETGQ